MPDIKAFDGSLLHSGQIMFTLPQADILNAGNESDTFEIELISQQCLSQCLYRLPVLKELRGHIWFTKPDEWDMDDAGRIVFIGTLYNLNSESVPADIIESKNLNFENLGSMTYYAGDQWIGASPDTVINYAHYNIFKNYGKDGILLRPTISFGYWIHNVSSATMVLASARVILEFDIDWIQVTKAEFDDYLKELWFLQSL